MQSNNPRQIRGWLLDVYPSDFGKVAVWVISQNGERIKLTDTYQPCIYVSAKQDDLERLASSLFDNQKIASLKFVYKYANPTDTEKTRVIELTVKDCRQIHALTLEILRMGDYLRYELHNCDIQNDRAYLFSRDLFPLAFLEVSVSKSGLVYTLLDSVESIDYVIPNLRVVRLEVDIAKKDLIAGFDDAIDRIRLKPDDKEEITIDYGDEATKLLQLVYAINELNPDIIVTNAGDSYLFPYLIQRAAINNVQDEFVLSRDNVRFKNKSSTGMTYFSYGHTFYRADTMRLHGRIHVDEKNTFIITESGFDGFIEIARTCRVPLHTAARFSIGSSMSSIQFYQAMKDDFLLPRNKKIPEAFKSALDLLVGDRGGFVYEPILGVHGSVGELDFSSMYPSLMEKYNISAETVLCECCPDSTVRIPELNYHICTKRQGMVPKTVHLALSKRLTYKRLKNETADKRLKQVYDSRQTALKWILVTCFGYLGFKNSKFGTVDGHIGVCAYARENFLKATHIAEDAGFEVVHGIVDSLWLKKKNASLDEYQELCKVITKEIGVPINFEGHYKWIAFLPSKLHPNVSVLNRYFGVMEDGKIKVRGLEVRRRDTPKFVYDAQMDMIKALSLANNAEEFEQKIPEALNVVKMYRQKLINGEVAGGDLIMTRHLSKNPKHYKQHVSQLIAAEQLIKQGVDIHAGNNVTFLFTDSKNKRFNRRVIAEKLMENGANPDTRKYLLLLYASAETLLSVKGYTAKSICDAVNGYSANTLSKYLP
jgi:DNA polymerase-2